MTINMLSSSAGYKKVQILPIIVLDLRMIRKLLQINNDYMQLLCMFGFYAKTFVSGFNRWLPETPVIQFIWTAQNLSDHMPDGKLNSSFSLCYEMYLPKIPGLPKFFMVSIDDTTE
jgi:hypothetical protein